MVSTLYCYVKTICLRGTYYCESNITFIKKPTDENASYPIKTSQKNKDSLLTGCNQMSTH